MVTTANAEEESFSAFQRNVNAGRMSNLAGSWQQSAAAVCSTLHDLCATNEYDVKGSAIVFDKEVRIDLI